MKRVFPEKPAVRPLAGDIYELVDDFFFPVTIGEWRATVHVKPGFQTDGASIPRFLWRVFGSPYDPDIMPSAIGHDAMYRGRIVPRKTADRTFLEMMRTSGIPERKRKWIYRGVRTFGWVTTWRKHTPESVAEAREFLELAFEEDNNKKKRRLSTMKKMTMVAAFAAFALAGITGCKSIEVERHGQAVAYDESGAVIKTAAGDPLVLDKGWKVDYFQHWNTQKFDSLSAKAGEATLDINNYASQSDSNLVALIDTSFKGTADLTSRIAAAIATSGGATAGDAALTLASSLYQKFKSSGGDEAKASVSTDPTGKVTVTDGTVCTTCKTDGACTAGTCSP